MMPIVRMCVCKIDFLFMLIEPLALQDKKIEIYKNDSNILAKDSFIL